MSDEPTVSVVIPTYDRAGVLSRAIDSALAQAVDDLEVVVVDDGSTDETRAVVAGYEDPALRYVRQANAGANAARNRGIAEADGAYVSLLDSDDELLEGHLPAVLDALRRSPPSVRGAVTADARVGEGPAGEERVEKVTRPGATGERLGVDDVRDVNVLGGFSSTTFEREAFEDVGPLDESMPAAQDYEFFLRYLRAYEIVCVDRVLVHSHVGADSISVDADRKRRANEALLERHGDVLSDRRRARQRFAEGIAAARAGDLADARAAFARSLRRRPQASAAYFYLATLTGRTGFEHCYRVPYRLRGLYHRLTLDGASPRGG